MENNKYQLLGLAKRAGKVLTGELALEAIKTKHAKLAIIAEDAGSNISKKVNDKCTSNNVPLINADSIEQLSKAIGAKKSVLVVVTDEGFAKSMMK